MARRLTDHTLFVPEAHPVSVFMAGSPGAGKTEISDDRIR
ncbi:MAG: zeta toxin family protein [Acidiferrobacteraceae bacterium]